MTNIVPPNERLIVALDVPSIKEARHLVDLLGETVCFYKVGLELFLSGDVFKFLDWLSEKNKKIFVDLKFFDVPATVARAMQQLQGLNITFATVHGNDSMLQAATEVTSDVGVLAVTALTSLDRGDLDDLGFECDLNDLVCSRARRAVEHGCVGVVASGQETNIIRQHLNRDLIIVVPGIRPIDNKDDQKRTVTVSHAFYDGADYIVVGRPIRDSKNPSKSAASIQREIESTVNLRIKKETKV
tara:strand:+ start:259 stop:987 length:729 start_codon:yes stop_codon:yes gene_type:complete